MSLSLRVHVCLQGSRFHGVRVHHQKKGFSSLWISGDRCKVLGVREGLSV